MLPDRLRAARFLLLADDAARCHFHWPQQALLPRRSVSSATFLQDPRWPGHPHLGPFVALALSQCQQILAIVSSQHLQMVDNGIRVIVGGSIRCVVVPFSFLRLLIICRFDDMRPLTQVPFLFPFALLRRCRAVLSEVSLSSTSEALFFSAMLLPIFFGQTVSLFLPP